MKENEMQESCEKAEFLNEWNPPRQCSMDEEATFGPVSN